MEVLRLFAAHQSNREIADALFVTIGTVKWYAQQIFNKLGVSDRKGAVARAREIGLLERETVLTAEWETPHNLPVEITSFIGRERELAHLRALLADVRLITLTGPGGTGKTRLAVRMGWQVLNDFRDGVFFVDLVPLSDPAFVPREIARVLGVREVAGEPLVKTLREALRHRSTLLILDNFEHLMGAAEIVPALLAAAPKLKILATSREVLRVGGEHEVFVPPLNLPASINGDSLTELERYDAIALFVQRARAVRADFALTAENVAAVVQICTQLDALPLAIELAAARIKLFSPQAMIRRLDDPLSLLSGGIRDTQERHRALRATIAWSYHLLAPDEQRMFEQMGIFAGGASFEAVDAVCALELPADLINMLNSLVDKSLLQQREGVDGEPRFWMLETIREYALEQLEARGGVEEARRKHAHYFVQMAKNAFHQLTGPAHHLWYARLDQENDNLRTALEWLITTGDCEYAADLAEALYRFWLRLRPVEGYAWTERILEHCRPLTVKINGVFIMASRLAFNIGRTDRGRAFAEEALVRGRMLDDYGTIGNAIGALALHEVARLPLEDIEAMFSEALVHFKAANHLSGQAWINSALGVSASVRGRYEEAAVYQQEARQLYREAKHVWGYAGAQQNTGLNELMRGNLDEAVLWFRRSMKFHASAGTFDAIANSLVGLAGVALGTGALDTAARYLATTGRIRDDFGVELDYPERALYEQFLRECRASLGEDSYEQVRAEVERLPLDTIIVEAVGDLPPEE